MGWRVGVDSGGTFTDICLFEEESGRIEIWKVPSTPHDPSIAIGDGSSEALQRVGATLAGVSYFGHGTTVATNALIQHRGVRTGLITTDGFRDLIEIGRQKRPDLYDIQADKPQPLATRDLRIGVVERIAHDGSVETPLDETAVRQAARDLKAAGAEAVAIAFLYSFVHADHEERARQILAEEFPEAFVSISHRVAPEFREYERISTTVVNAYLGPVMQGYVRRLQKRLNEGGLGATPHLTQSNGGVISFETAVEMPVRTVLSGPSTGVVAAQALGAMTGIADLITFDMGGTSTDVALLSGGMCRVVGDAVVHGYPIKAPMLDIHTVGAGGGSIVHIDSGGLVKVGPRSAGAFPGPACYGHGSLEPTVTDANVFLQALNPEHLLRGRMKVHRALARDALATVADQVGMSVEQAADGILDIVTASMAKAIRVISVQRGHDPRDYALVAFGGAGPLHAARLAHELDMSRVLVPLTPGILCAMGLLMTDLRTDYAVTRLALLDALAPSALDSIYADLEMRAATWFTAEGIHPDAQRMHRAVEARYKGQNYEISIEIPAGVTGEAAIDAIRQGFTQAHQRLYGFAVEDGEIQLVTFRLQAVGVVDKARFRPRPLEGADASAAVMAEREVWCAASKSFRRNIVYDRHKLAPGNVVHGPAIIDQMDTTTVVPAGCVARVDPYLNIIMEIGR
ncbi:hydantoinase/oxoprolinase family protein [Mesorhizobium australicum]|uniref:N-methylhydantoinase A n=1 Tax=Mesorhizobium australicum TaxID=536018 RepID=A0A1X7NHC5_9HYPH|nr:hydantoinase/oxoprolinase family protein [Mesorhizobium australicum]SMH36759.1 N-methylhydantoinase A [Mesorhizobium australicum]